MTTSRRPYRTDLSDPLGADRADAVGVAPVHGYLALWEKEGITEAIHDALRGRVREATGRPVEPTAAILDAQTVKPRATCPNTAKELTPELSGVFGYAGPSAATVVSGGAGGIEPP